MKKMFYCILIAMMIMFTSLINIDVVEADGDSPGYTVEGEVVTGDSDIEGGCEGLLGSDFITVLKEGYGWMEFFAVALLVILGSLDFGKAITSDDSDGLKKAAKKFRTRLIIVVVIFILPAIINIVLKGFLDSDTYTTCIYDK